MGKALVKTRGVREHRLIGGPEKRPKRLKHGKPGARVVG